MSDKIIFNEKEITEEELNKLQEKAKEEKNVEIIEVTKKVYKKRLKD